jgi:MIP family channel proteins
VAEFIGTFALVFFITTTIVLFAAPGGGNSDWAVIGLVHAFVLFLIVQSLGSISGAHVNPAVTLALAALRKIRPNDAVVYLLLQLSGAVAGALVCKFILKDAVADASGPVSARVGTPSVSATLVENKGAAVLAEGLGAFFLVWAVIAVAVNPRAARDWAGLAIGATLGLVVMVIGPLTGAGVNPARWFGPALVSGYWHDWWIYIVGPGVGGVLAAVIYWALFVEGRIGPVDTADAGPVGLRQDVPPSTR